MLKDLLKLLLLLVFTFFVSVVSYAQKVPGFEINTGVKTDSFYKHVVSYEDCSFATKETIYNYGDGTYDIILSKYNSCLELQWSKKITAQGYYSVGKLIYRPYLSQICAAEDGNLLLVYTEFSKTDNVNPDWVRTMEANIVKFDTKGEILWSKKFNRSNKINWQIANLNCHYIKDDGYFIAGSYDSLWYSATEGGGTKVIQLHFYLKISSEGEYQFSRKYFPFSSNAYLIEQVNVNVLKDKSIVYCDGRSLLKIDKYGTPYFHMYPIQSSQNPFAAPYNYLQIAAVDADENIYCTGEIDPYVLNKQNTNFIIKFNSKGERVWCYTFADSLNKISNKGFILKNFFIDKSNTLQLIFAARQPRSLYATLIVSMDTAANIISGKYFNDINLITRGRGPRFDSYSNYDKTGGNNNTYTRKDISFTSDSGLIFISNGKNGNTIITKLSKTFQNNCYLFTDSILTLTPYNVFLSDAVRRNFFGGPHLVNHVWNVSDNIIQPSLSCAGKYAFVNIGTDTILCDTNSFTLKNANAGNFNMRWSTGDATGSILINKSGKYWLSVTNGFCTNTDTVNIIFRNELKNFYDTLLICNNDSILLNYPHANTKNFYWITPSQKRVNSSKMWVREIGKYYLFANGKGSCNAVDTLDVRLSADDLNLSLTANKNNICKGEEVIITANATGGLKRNYNYSWDSQRFSKDNEYYLKPIKSAWLKCVVSDDCGNNSTDSIFVEVQQMPKANFILTPNDSGIAEQSVLFTNSSQHSTEFLWIFGNGDSSKAFSPKTIYGDTGKYMVKLIAYNQYGCTDTFTNTVYIREKYNIFIPNAFTPNNDGVNDDFGAHGSGIITYDLRIFHRTGALIYRSKNITDKWDGKLNGKILPMDVYLYKINIHDINTQQHKFIGTVNLLI